MLEQRAAGLEQESRCHREQSAVRAAERLAAAHAASPFEPVSALYGGWDGLVFYRRIASEAPRWLEPGGLLELEIDDGLEQAILNLLCRAGLHECRWSRDLAGLPRYVEAYQPE